MERRIWPACTCGGWAGGDFATVEAGPFDDHLEAAILAHLAERLRSSEVAAWLRVLAMADAWRAADSERTTTAALAAVAEALGVEA